MSTRRITTNTPPKLENSLSTNTIEYIALESNSSIPDDISINTDNDVLSSNHDSFKSDGKIELESDLKRLTRNSPSLVNSPILTSSPQSISKKLQPVDGSIDSEFTNSESEDCSNTKRSTQIKGRKSLKDALGTTDSKDECNVTNNKTDIESNNLKDIHKTTSDTKEGKVLKEIKEKDSKQIIEQKDENIIVSAAPSNIFGSGCNLFTTNVTNSAAASNNLNNTTNRLTRQSLAQELASSSRVTRNRQRSTSRSETPPISSTRSRRSVINKKLNRSLQEPLTKRKRSEEESSVESGEKIIKIESEDFTELDREENILETSTCKNKDLGIKQEDVENEDSSVLAVSNSTNITGRSKNRYVTRKQHTNFKFSPSTRATRQTNKISSPTLPLGTACEYKRRRTVTSSKVTRSSSFSLLKPLPVAINHIPDDDSKDSIASSIDDNTLKNIKIEKNTSDINDKVQDINDKNNKNHIQEEETKSSCSIQTKISNISEMNNIPCSKDSKETEKSSSLSPEMMCEGVSEISVKQFYKKPQFLENNLGIEEDPKLGNIVQKVTSNEEGGEKSEDMIMIVNEIDIDSSELTCYNKYLIDNSENSVKSLENADKLTNEDSSTFSKVQYKELSTEAEGVENIFTGKLDEYELNKDDSAELLTKNKEMQSYQEDGKEVLELNESINQGINKKTLEICDNKEAKLKNVDEEFPFETKSILDENRTLSNDSNEPTNKCDIVPLLMDTNNETRNNNKVLEDTLFEANTNKNTTVESITEDILNVTNKNTNLDSALNLSEDNKDHVKSDNDANSNLELEIIEETCLPKILDKVEQNSNDERLFVDDLTANEIEVNVKDINNLLEIDGNFNQSNNSILESNEVVESNLNIIVVAECEKEQHLRNLGLVTHKAAEKRRQENIQSSASANVASRVSQHQTNNKRSNKSNSCSSHEYTGTLKTVIKLNRNSSGVSTGPSNISSRKMTPQSIIKDVCVSGGIRRQSLKMTFQKGRGKGRQGSSDRTSDLSTHNETYYTIQNENEDSSHSEGPETNVCLITHKKDDKEKILIPEKASSFKFHPGRLCEDQCYYCSGKFGLYDTPCHVGQLKSIDRQQKILSNEEKLTVDNCLCDACFRHVDRRANVPSYKKRVSASGQIENSLGSVLPSGDIKNSESEDITDKVIVDNRTRKCVVPECTNDAAHSLRRKCIRKSVKKYLLNFDMPPGAAFIWLCRSHYDAVIQCSGCVLCKRRLGKNHMYHITSDTVRLENALFEMGIPVQLGVGTAVCKLCRYFANLLMKPPDNTKSQKAEFVKNYRKRLLQFHNIHDGSNEGSEQDEEITCGNKGKKGNIRNSNLSKSNKNGDMDTNELDSSVQSQHRESTVECLNLNKNSEKEHSSEEPDQVINRDILDEYEMPAIISTDSNSSSSTTPDRNEEQMSKLKAILQSNNKTKSSSPTDISKVLRSNPNISMRELFPGEEDLGLNFKVAFGGSSSHRTPEGWTRVETFLQYDEPTRRLWEELEKPYGNQSSFLRHLILLEKYYRNGDLVLSPNASSNASVYTQTVRQRLTSYDQGHCGGLLSAKPICKDLIKTYNSIEPDKDIENSIKNNKSILEKSKRNETLCTASAAKKMNIQSKDSVDNITKQLCTNAVTIIARSKESTKVSDNAQQKSLLKEKDTTSSNFNVPLSSSTIVSSPSSASTSINFQSHSRSILKTNLLGMNKSVEILPISNASNSFIGNSAKNVSTISNIAHGETKQQKILDVANKLLSNQLDSSTSGDNVGLQSKTSNSSVLTSPPELVSLKRRLSSANSFIVPGSISSSSFNSPGTSLITTKRTQLLAKPNANRSFPPPNIIILPNTLTAQERLQTKSWRPTLLGVEENQHLLNKSSPFYQTADGRRLPALVQVQSGGKPFLISIFDYNRMCILRREKLMRDQMLKSNKNRTDVKHQNLRQNASGLNLQAINKNNQQVAQQQLLQLQLLQYQKTQQATMKTNTGRFQFIAPKPSTSSTYSTPSSTNGSGTFSASMMPVLANTITNVSASGNSNTSTNVSNSSWLWNNFPDSNQLLVNGAQTPKLPQLMPKPTTIPITSPNNSASLISPKHQQQTLLDNTLMSKIPKSLTVIPQHKLMSAASVSAANCLKKVNVHNVSKD